MSPCHMLLYLAVLGLVVWATPDILSAIGRALGAVWRPIKRHPTISTFVVLIALMMAVH